MFLMLRSFVMESPKFCSDRVSHSNILTKANFKQTMRIGSNGNPQDRLRNERLSFENKEIPKLSDSKADKAVDGIPSKVFYGSVFIHAIFLQPLQYMVGKEILRDRDLGPYPRDDRAVPNNLLEPILPVSAIFAFLHIVHTKLKAFRD
ncbi:uncharacterized protein G2W53_013538 [Senna tora]|uniref:Uncharacterized protein n=1 Tax=Senna tora TaxID=362788 RepID=A0A834U2J2_9FABA|nr:uncharacterized protein G2W53_013538 [Senna tora]